VKKKVKKRKSKAFLSYNFGREGGGEE